MAISPLSRLEIAQWAADELIPLERWERRILLRIDAEFRRLIGGAEDDDESEEEG